MAKRGRKKKEVVAEAPVETKTTTKERKVRKLSMREVEAIKKQVGTLTEKLNAALDKVAGMIS